MSELPIAHINLYKNGIGFFERRGTLVGDKVNLLFRVEDMNDVLKSLTVVDRGKGQVLGMDYTTPQTVEERLASCSVRLRQDHSLCDLVKSLRGRSVTLMLDQQESSSGTLIGLDTAAPEQPLKTSLVSILLDERSEVRTVPLERIQSIHVADVSGQNDLRFFLESSLNQGNFRQITIRLTPGEHDLSVSYIAPAPTWRVSYRLILDPETHAEQPEALLQGWGIFDNRLEEDLKEISLSLVGGMPISFVYDLCSPFVPKRPVLKEESRVATGHVDFERKTETNAGQNRPRENESARVDEILQQLQPEECDMVDHLDLDLDMESDPAVEESQAKQKRSSNTTLNAWDMETSITLASTTEEMDELFHYNVGTPVTVGRGQSAMVPITLSGFTYRKELFYNSQKMPKHPIAVVRFENGTGLTLERGPVTVIENGSYIGEAILPFTPAQGELVIPYAVELGVRIHEQTIHRIEVQSVHFENEYLQIEEWLVLERNFQVVNDTERSISILLEHPRGIDSRELHDSPEPFEMTMNTYRFKVEIEPRQEKSLKIQQRQLNKRSRKIGMGMAADLQTFLRNGLLGSNAQIKIAKLDEIWKKKTEIELKLTECFNEREQLFDLQKQIQGNMPLLKTEGKEGLLRSKYVEKMENIDEQLKELSDKEKRLRSEMKTLEDHEKELLKE